MDEPQKDEEMLSDAEIRAEEQKLLEERELKRRNETAQRQKDNLKKAYEDLARQKLALDEQALAAGMQYLNVENDVSLLDLFPDNNKEENVSIVYQNCDQSEKKSSQIDKAGTQHVSDKKNHRGRGGGAHNFSETQRGGHGSDQHGRGGGGGYNSGRNYRGGYDNRQNERGSYTSGQNQHNTGRNYNHRGRGAGQQRGNNGVEKRKGSLSDKRLVRKLQHDIIQMKKKTQNANKIIHIH